MKIRRIKKLKVNSTEFQVKWNKSHGGASFNYRDRKLEIGTNDDNAAYIFMLLCHELWEIVACEMRVRLCRPDCDSDYIFVYDHRQHETMAEMFSALLSQFIV